MYSAHHYLAIESAVKNGIFQLRISLFQVLRLGSYEIEEYFNWHG